MALLGLHARSHSHFFPSVLRTELVDALIVTSHGVQSRDLLTAALLFIMRYLELQHDSLFRIMIILQTLDAIVAHKHAALALLGQALR